MTPKSTDTLRSGFYAGSFNPFTIAHFDIAKRALRIMDRLVIGVGHNINKHSLSEDELNVRLNAIRNVFQPNENIEVVAYSDLTIEAARRHKCNVLIRGIRNTSDCENELNLAQINRKLSPGIETIFFPTAPELSFISSSMVRELQAFGHDVTQYLPDPIR